MNRSTVLFLIAVFVGASGSVRADDYTVYVAPKKSAAYEFAKAQADDETLFAERSFHKGLGQAAELLAAGGAHTVTVLVAGGEYYGKAKQGVWVLPAVDNPEGSLRILGGFNDDFTERKPFESVSGLVTIDGRNGAILSIEKKTKLRQLVISGFLFDAAPSNKYDAKSNSLLKASSRSYPLVSLSLISVDHLVVDSNIFLNGAHGAIEPYVAPLSGESVVDFTNNFFLNTIKATSTQATSFRGNTLKELNFRNNSFLLCWPFNPDATSSEVSAINLYHSDGCQQLNIEGNIFAYNPGGALQHDWPEDRMPAFNLSGNLFHQNAGLFGDGADEGGVIAGKLGHNPRYLILDIETVEDDFDYDVEDNVVIDPMIPIALVDVEAADSYSVERKNTVLNDVRRLFGLNQDGGTVAISDFAPALVFNTETLPLPANAEAQAYGVQIDRIWTP